TDGAERIGMAILLQRALNRGWLDGAAESSLQAWAEFAKEWLLDDTGAMRRGSSMPPVYGTRLYDLPLIADFFIERYQFSKDPADLDLATKIMLRLAELGG